MSTSALSVLLRTKRLSHEEWVDFLENVRKELNPLLDRFTLPRLGDLGCVHSEEDNDRYRIIYDDAERYELGLPLDTHAIAYFVDSGRHRPSPGCPSKTQVVWALTKASEWVIMEVTVRLVPSERKGMTRERVLGTKVSQTTLEDMLRMSGEDPFRVWRCIKMEIDSWKSKQEAKYNRVRAISERFDGYDLMLKHTLVIDHSA